MYGPPPKQAGIHLRHGRRHLPRQHAIAGASSNLSNGWKDDGNITCSETPGRVAPGAVTEWSEWGLCGCEPLHTSALATRFLAFPVPVGSAYVIGEAGLITALHDVGFTINDVNPDYVVVGETSNYNYEKILKAVQMVLKGAKLIGTNPDVTGPVESGIAPATRALVSPIEMATGKQAYFIGKPNPLMMRTAQKRLGIHSADTVIVGDRMDTDILASSKPRWKQCWYSPVSQPAKRSRSTPTAPVTYWTA